MHPQTHTKWYFGGSFLFFPLLRLTAGVPGPYPPQPQPQPPRPEQEKHMQSPPPSPTSFPPMLGAWSTKTPPRATNVAVARRPFENPPNPFPVSPGPPPLGPCPSSTLRCPAKTIPPSPSSPSHLAPSHPQENSISSCFYSPPGQAGWKQGPGLLQPDLGWLGGFCRTLNPIKSLSPAL